MPSDTGASAYSELSLEERDTTLRKLLSAALGVAALGQDATLSYQLLGAVPGIAAKPIIDLQVEVTSLDRVRREIVPIMEDLGYEFIWRPTMGERAPFYAWFIKRGPNNERTHHVHMVEPDQASEDRILFRDLLRSDPHEATRYEALKRTLSERFGNDRAAYTRGKTDFIQNATLRARAVRSS